MTNFDAGKYWQERLAGYPGLQGTGTNLLPLAWQRWLYRGKERAYRRLLKQAEADVAGLQVLDFGCGTGYFEDFWEALGASRADGLDIVPEIIDNNRKKYPHRRYLCTDISKDLTGLEMFGAPGLVTAIDVFYHIVDDTRLAATLGALAGIIPKHGRLLFTDALSAKKTGPHVRFRALEQWIEILKGMDLSLVAREPVFVLNNRPLPGAMYFPGAIGAAQHFGDALALRLLPGLANNWALLFRKD